MMMMRPRDHNLHDGCLCPNIVVLTVHVCAAHIITALGGRVENALDTMEMLRNSQGKNTARSICA